MGSLEGINAMRLFLFQIYRFVSYSRVGINPTAMAKIKKPSL